MVVKASAVIHFPVQRKSNSLIKFTNLASWMKDNESILTGYRQASYSTWSCIRSIFYIHNEIGNIWSHLLGTVWFSSLLVSFVRASGAINGSDKYVVYIYYLTVINCFTWSTIFHVFLNHSKEYHELSNNLDYLGIVLVNWGTAIPCTYFTFYDTSRKLRYIHYGLICTAAVASAVCTLRNKFRGPQYRHIRFCTYVLLGCSTFLPIFHGLYAYGITELEQRMSLTNFLGLAAWNLCAGTIYILRVPERWYPGEFDIWGSSHQIMHILVVFGAFTYMQGLFKALEFWAGK